MSGGIFVGVEKYLIGGIIDVTKGLMMQYSSMIMGFSVASATIYIMWKGYQSLAGKLSTPMEDIMWDIMRMTIILSCVANINGYLDGIISAINGIKDGFTGSGNIWELLDGLWNKAKILGKTLHDLDESTVVKDEGWTAQFYVWLGVFVLMIVCAFVSMIAEVMILLLGITSPIFIFCLMYGFLRPMFNNWLQNIFSGILTVLFSSLSLNIIINYLDSLMKKATTLASQSTIVELGAQVCLAGICAAVLVYFSAKLAASLAGASATVSMQGLSAMGISVAALGAKKTLSSSGKDMKNAMQRNSMGYSGKPNPPGGGAKYNAKEARKYAIEQMIARNEARWIAEEKASSVEKK
ncbi:MAG: type IV secretion system protein [Candidatus Symbiopectobacterium sp. Dall1.0]|nr:type IV secretion system protein [Candidatus Symbiopectobacterium sp. Dall1.0]